MIFFAADNHYATYPGRVLLAKLKERYSFDFYEDDWSGFTKLDSCAYRLLMLNMIGGTCDIPAPEEQAAEAVHNYLRRGGHLLLLHGASAAFGHYAWWRDIVGYRWVRPNDPERHPPSSHPVRPFTVKVCPAVHPLISQLQNLDLPADEVYINLEKRNTVTELMLTTTDEGTFVQAYTLSTPWGGTILAFLPGHLPEVITSPGVITNICVMLDYLVGKSA